MPRPARWSRPVAGRWTRWPAVLRPRKPVVAKLATANDPQNGALSWGRVEGAHWSSSTWCCGYGRVLRVFVRQVNRIRPFTSRQSSRRKQLWSRRVRVLEGRVISYWKPSVMASLYLLKHLGFAVGHARSFRDRALECWSSSSPVLWQLRRGVVGICRKTDQNTPARDQPLCVPERHRNA